MDLKLIIQETQAKLKTLPPRPSTDTIEVAQKLIAGIEKKLVANLESILQVPAESEESRALLDKKQAIASSEAEAEKRRPMSVLQLEEQYRHYEEVIRRAELAMVGNDGQAEANRIIKQEAARKLLFDIDEIISTGATEVDWSNRDLESVPENFGKMVSVKKLDLSRNFIEVLPDAIAGLSNLEDLNLRSNRLAKLPDSIGALTKLRVLDAAKNDLLELPDSICNCSALEDLNVTFNKLEALPSKLATCLTSLRKLSIGLNKIRQFPSNMNKLQELEHLDAHFNQLHDVPPSLGALHKLKFLDLSDNFADLVFLPASLGELSSLTDLNLANNQISDLPVEFGKLTQLKKLTLEGNPWRSTPLEIVEKKDTALTVQYLEQRYKESLTSVTERSAVEEWGKWLGSIFGGSTEFSAWLNGIMTGLQTPQLTWQQQQGASGAGGIQGTELRTVNDNEVEQDLEGGSSQDTLPTSSLDTRLAV